ncbi:IS66 family insertion sequence element accessory protein TnpB [Bradyrhizobium agreste]|uniref:IS66 family insertion sequence element accessory protein TnpB n=1 Tax=Bradyrhizobium agreste TaxID=2751811 RepID=UPI0018D962E4
MRKGFASFSLQVQQVLRRDPLSGHLFCFHGRRGDLLKVIWHDGKGACLFTKKLERGRFIWPWPPDGVVSISQAQRSYLCPASIGAIRRSPGVQPAWAASSSFDCGREHDSIWSWTPPLMDCRPISLPRLQ